jgi:rubrerythrin
LKKTAQFNVIFLLTSLKSEGEKMNEENNDIGESMLLECEICQEQWVKAEIDPDELCPTCGGKVRVLKDKPE